MPPAPGSTCSNPSRAICVLAEALHRDPAGLCRGLEFRPPTGGQPARGRAGRGPAPHWPGQYRDLSDPHAPHEAGLLHLVIDKASSAPAVGSPAGISPPPLPAPPAGTGRWQGAPRPWPAAWPTSTATPAPQAAEGNNEPALLEAPAAARTDHQPGAPGGALTRSPPDRFPASLDPAVDSPWRLGTGLGPARTLHRGAPLQPRLSSRLREGPPSFAQTPPSLSGKAAAVSGSPAIAVPR